MQLLRAVATRNGVAFLGGGLSSLEGAGTVVAFDPVGGSELWRIEPEMGAGIAALAVQGKNLYGLTRKGGLFVVDVPKRRIVHRSDISAVSRGFGALVANRGVIYGVSDTTVFRFDPKTFAVSTVVADTDGGWYSGSHITNDESGYLYTMRGRNLVRNQRPPLAGAHDDHNEMEPVNVYRINHCNPQSLGEDRTPRPFSECQCTD